jgi:uncharacterized protein (DUF2141 family)
MAIAALASDAKAMRAPSNRTRNRAARMLLFAALATTILVTRVFAARIVDPALVGTWELSVPNPQGTALWIWKINADGTYSFRSEGPGSVPPHSGQLSANRGQYTLKSTTMNWTDSGTYQLLDPSTMQATGCLGTGLWQRAGASIAPQGPAQQQEAMKAQDNQPGQINVHVVGVRGAGVVYCAMYTSPDGFPRNLKKSAGVTNSAISSGSADCGFYNEETGLYAILVFHDQSHTHRLRLDANGVPTEGYGVSNNSPASFRSLTFADARFDYRGGRRDLTIKMIYP